MKIRIVMFKNLDWGLLSKIGAAEKEIKRLTALEIKLQGQIKALPNAISAQKVILKNLNKEN